MKENEHEDRPELSCAKCGACTVVCPVFRIDSRESLSARGKMHLLSLSLAEHPSEHFQDIFSCCLLCGACEDSCSRQLPILDLVKKSRGRFSFFYGSHGVQKVVARKVLSSPGLLQGLVRAGVSLNRIKSLPVSSGLRLKLGLLEEPVSSPAAITEFSPAGDINYFSGCMARYLQPSISRAVVRLTHAIGHTVSHPEGQHCCGLAAAAAGREESAKKLAWLNIRSFSGSKGAIVTSCASCSSHLSTYPDLFAGDPEKQQQARAFSKRVVEFSLFFSDQPELVLRPEKKWRIFYHDPCHLRFSEKGNEASHQLIESIAGIERVESENGPQCCGQGGLFHIGYPELSQKIFQRCADGVAVKAPDMVVTTCSGCLMQWQQGAMENNLPLTVKHLALFMVDCLK